MTRRLPTGWRERAQTIARFGLLRVTAIGRLDLIAMKFIAGRPEDRKDLNALAVTRVEARFVREYLDELARSHPQERQHVPDAIELLEDGGLVRD